MTPMNHRLVLVVAIAALAIFVIPTQAGTMLPSRWTKGAGDKIFVVGDSLTVESHDPMIAAFEGRPVEVAAMGGAQIINGVGVVNNHDLVRVGTIVVALGTNDWFFNGGQDVDALIDQMMLVARGRRVVWVNVDLGSALHGAVVVNDALAAATARYPNLEIADWNRYFNGLVDAPSFRAPDGVHYNEAGFRVRGRWVAAVVAGRQPG